MMAEVLIPQLSLSETVLVSALQLKDSKTESGGAVHLVECLPSI